MARPIKLLLLLSPVILIGAIAWHRTQVEPGNALSPGDREADHSSPTGKLTDRPVSPKREREAVDQAAEEWYQKLLSDHPRLQIDYQDVPDEQNGYLQLIEFVESLGPDGALPETDEIGLVFSDPSAWDADRAAKWIADHPDILDRLLEISELDRQSMKGIAFPRQTSLRRSGTLGALLAAHGRLEFEKGNEDAARRSYTAAIRLARHVSGVEAPSLLQKIIAMGIRVQAQAGFQQHVLPGLQQDPESLQVWRQQMSTDDNLMAGYQRTIIGEWNFATRDAILPELLGASNANGLNGLPDPDAFIEAFTLRAEVMLDFTETATGPKSLLAFEPPSLDSLSPATRERLDPIGAWNSITNGFVADYSRNTMRDALIAAILGEELPLEPVTGQPFAWDPSTRTLSPPPEVEALDFVLEPLTLP